MTDENDIFREMKQAYEKIEKSKPEKVLMIVHPDDFQGILESLMKQGIVFRASGNLWNGYWQDERVIAIATSDTQKLGEALTMPLPEKECFSRPIKPVFLESEFPAPSSALLTWYGYD